MSVLGEFYVLLKANADTLQVKEFARTLGDIPMEAVGAIAALAGVSLGIRDIVETSLSAATGLQSFTSTTGLNAMELQKWQRAAQRVNVSGEEVTETLKNLQRQAYDTMLRGAPWQLGALGIGVTTDPFKIFRRLSEESKKFPPGLFSSILANARINPEFIRLFKLSAAERERLGSDAGGMTGNQEKKFLAIKSSLVQMEQVFRSFSYTLTEVMSGPLMTLIKSLAAEFKEMTADLRIISKFFNSKDSLPKSSSTLAEDLWNKGSGKGSASIAAQSSFGFFSSLAQVIDKIIATAVPVQTSKAVIAGAGTVINITMNNSGLPAEDLAENLVKELKRIHDHADSNIKKQGL